VTQVILGDSMLVMPALDMQFDMVFVDPPYFDWATEEPGCKKPDHNKLSYYVYKLLKPNGVVFLCGTIPQLAYDWKYWGRFFNINFELIEYHRAGGTPPISLRRPIPVHENIWCLMKKDLKLTDVPIDIRKAARAPGKLVRKEKTSKRPMRIRGGDFLSFRVSVGYPRDVFECRKINVHSKEYEGHPNQKPLRLMELLIRISTEPGDWVLDPFFGVGTTGVACDSLGRNCLGIEINPEYIRLYKRRRDRIRIQKMLKEYGYIRST